MKAWHPFFCLFFADTKKVYTDDLVNAVVIAVKSGTNCISRSLAEMVRCHITANLIEVSPVSDLRFVSSLSLEKCGSL
jgi:hypothetical protein